MPPSKFALSNPSLRTLRAARCVPADNIDCTWKIHLGRPAPPNRCHRTLPVCRKSSAPPQPLHQPWQEFADGRDAALALMERLGSESMEIFSKLTDASLQENA
jgi:hypothetical protein